MQSWIDTAMLASLECLSDALFPNFPNAQRTAATDASRTFLDGLLGKVGLKRFVITGASALDRRATREGVAGYRSKIATHAPELEGTLSRFSRRIDIGFSAGNGIDDVHAIKHTVDALTAVSNLAIDAGAHGGILDIALKLPSVNLIDAENHSLKSAIIGGISAANTSWDMDLSSIIDEEYDIPYLETIALKLRARSPEIEVMNLWREALAPQDYEAVRSYICAFHPQNSSMKLDVAAYDSAVLPY